MAAQATHRTPSIPRWKSRAKKTKRPARQRAGQKRKFLDTYCENLTDKAHQGKLDRIVGRDKEIYRAVQILCRRQKNNPCLIGEAGVGKRPLPRALHCALPRAMCPAG